MKRVNYHLTEKQIDALRKHSDLTGLSVAELIRRAVDAWLNEMLKEDIESLKGQSKWQR